MNRPDVIVIGAGIAGASAAAQLSAHCQVLLLERETRPGYHATGRSAAYFEPGYGNEVIRQVTAASESFFRSTPDGFADVPLLRPRPALFIATEQQEASLRKMVEAVSGQQLIDIATACELVPLLDPGRLSMASINTEGGDLDVDAILGGFLRRFRSRGGEIRTGSEVHKLTRQHNTWTVTCGDETFKAPLIINAAGAWADKVAELAGLAALGLTPLRRTALLVDAPAEMNISEWPLVIDTDEQFYFKPDAGQLLLSPADETPSDPCDAMPDELDIAVAIDRIQQVTSLEARKVNHSWSGLRTFAPDRTFIVGPDPRTEGFFWLAGQGGYGIQSCPGLADITSYLVTGQTDIADENAIRPLLDKLKPDRLIR